MICYIVAKTHVKDYYCIGAITETGKNIRLSERDDFPFMPKDSPFEVVGVWNLKFRSSHNLNPPHSEDVVLLEQKYHGPRSNIVSIIQSISGICQGDFDSLYNGLLEGPVRSGNMYLDKNRPIPSNSVEFWRSATTMTFEITGGIDGKPRRAYRVGNYSIPYVGVSEPVRVIRAQTLVRTSLTRWLPMGQDPHLQRCWMQISQVYT